MGADIMALIASHEWKVNMVGVVQENQIGADTAEEEKELQNTIMNSNTAA